MHTHNPILTGVQNIRINSWKTGHILLKNLLLKLIFQDEGHLYGNCLFYIFSFWLKCFPVFCDFNIIRSHIFPENFIEIPLVVQKIWRFSFSILTNFIDFSDFLTKKLMASVYNRWCQHLFYIQPTLNRLFNNCIKLYWY